MSIRTLAVALAATAALAAALAATPQHASPAHAAAPPPPNIVVVMTDDQPALDGRLMLMLPTLKRLFVDRGVTFAHARSESPLCCPARAGYLTGQHTHNHGVTWNSAKLLNPSETIATAMQRAGYRTILEGKYLNSFDSRSCPPANADCAPNVPPGWDVFDAFGDPAYYDYTLWENGTPQTFADAPADYSTDVVASRAADAIRSAPSGQPLFAWIAPYGPHAPSTPAPRYEADRRCAAEPMQWSPPNFNEADVSDKPAYVRVLPLRPGTAFRLVSTCQSLLPVDDLVARVEEALSASGRLQNTILVFAGDNGMSEGAHRLTGKEAPYITEVPLYVHWPRLGTAPRTIDPLVQNIDLAPTLCELAGCTLGPYPNGQARPDGRSFLGLLTGRSSTLPRDAVLEEMLAPSMRNDAPPWRALRTLASSPLASVGCSTAARGGCRWHYVEYADGETELYDEGSVDCWAWSPGQPDDPCELQNLAGQPGRGSLEQALHDRLAQLAVARGQ